MGLSGMFYEEFGVGLSCIKERGFWAKVLMSSPSSHRFHPFARQSSVAPPAPLSKILSDFSFVLSQQQNALQQIHNEVFVLRQEILQLKEACFNLLEQHQVSFCFLQFFLFSDVFSFFRSESLQAMGERLQGGQFTWHLSQALQALQRMEGLILERRVTVYLPTLMEQECALPLLGEEGGAMDKLLSKVRDLVEEHEVMMNHYHCYKVCVLPIVFLSLY